MRENRVAERMLCLYMLCLYVMYKGTKCSDMRGANQVSSFVPEVRGIKQVCGFSPYLYMIP